MTTHRTREIKSSINRKTEHFTTGVIDSKGRVEGLEIVTWECEFETIPENEHVGWWNLTAPGYKFACNMQKTKNNKYFGAGQRSQYFETIGERERAIAKRKAKAGIK